MPLESYRQVHASEDLKQLCVFARSAHTVLEASVFVALLVVDNLFRSA